MRNKATSETVMCSTPVSLRHKANNTVLCLFFVTLMHLKTTLLHIPEKRFDKIELNC